jgi:peroxiredoxin
LSNCQNVIKGHFEANYRVPVMEAMGAWGEKSMYGKKVMGTIRLGFIVS